MSYLASTDITDKVVSALTLTSYLEQADQALEDLAEQMGIRDTSTISTNAGDVAGAVLVKGASQTGTSLIIDGLTNATGTIKTGARLRITGLSRTYTVEADATIAASQATLTIYPELEAAPADNAPVTFTKLHNTVRRWMIAQVSKNACLDASFVNNNEQNPDFDKYYLKYKEYSVIENDLKKMITAEMISNEVDEKLDRVSMFGTAVRG